MLELEIKQLRAQQTDGKPHGPHPYQQTLKRLMHTLSQATLTFEKVEKLHESDGAQRETKEERKDEQVVDDEVPPQVGVKRPRTE